MAGAYTAKPADAVADTKPPGWGGWPFLGEEGVFPFPPGYEPELSFITTASGPVGVSAGGSIRYGQDSDVKLTLYDKETYPANVPSGSKIRLTAVIGGRMAMPPTTVSYEELEDNFWGHSDNYLFSLIEDDEGEQIWLSAYTTINEWPVWGDVYIDVYNPTYSLSLGTPEPVSVAISDPTVSVQVKLYDAGAYATNEPEDYELTWTATVEGREVMDPVTVSYSNVEGLFWGDNGNFEFDLIESDEGKILVLSVEGTVWGGDEVSDSVDIEIGLLPVSFVATVVLNSWELDPVCTMKCRLKITRTPTTKIDWPQFGGGEGGDPPPTWWADDDAYDNIPEITCVATEGPAARIDASGDFEDNYTYTFNFDANEGGNATINVTWTMEVTMSDDTVYSDSETFTIIPSGDTRYQTSLVSTITGVVYIFGVRVN